ncbi:AfsR/SARP family transcriptional regulator [Amycolatopsis sp. NPDC054798]
MEFHFLGPVEVTAGSKQLQIGGMRQQITVATLMLSANRVVTMDRLLAAIYGDNLPPTARSQAQIGISSIRRLFASCGHPEIISTHPNGYSITTDPLHLDAHRFEHLVAVARAANEPEQAVARYRDALRLWRGPALHGIDSHLIRVAAGRLDELRLSVIEDRIELELRLGRHHELVGELTELVDENPLRERFQGQLMLALHNCGRTAEALQAYWHARKTIVDELGIDPGERLQRLQRAILASDPTLRPQIEPVRVHAAKRQVPRLLPIDIGDFIGREQQVAEIRQRLAQERPEDRSAVPVMVITGKRGTGKTSLAVHVSHSMKDRFSGGQLFVDLHGSSTRPLHPNDVLERFIRLLGVSASEIPASLDERAETYRNILADRQVLITLDDAADESQITPLLPGSATAAVVVTSTRRLTGIPAARHVEVGVFNDRESLDLLRRIVGTARILAQPDAAAAIAKVCGHLPLALRIAGARLAALPNWSIQRLLDRLTDETRLLDELRHRDLDIRSRISQTYESISENAACIFRRLALLDTPTFTSWIGAALIDRDIYYTEDILNDLVDARLIEEVDTGRSTAGRYRFHNLTRAFAQERLEKQETQAERENALERAVGTLVALAEEASARFFGEDRIWMPRAAPRSPLPERLVDRLVADPLAWIEHERPVLARGIRQAAAHGLVDLCWRLAFSVLPLWEARQRTDDGQDVFEIALEAATKSRNLRGQAMMLYCAGALHKSQQRFELAHRELTQAAQEFQRLADAQGVALAQRHIDALRRSVMPQRRALAG